MYVFKEAFFTVRENREIFLGFGLEHGEDAASFYRSGDERVLDERIAISQGAGEGVNLLLDLLEQTGKGLDKRSNIRLDGSQGFLYAELYPSDKWYDAGIIPAEVRGYRLAAETFSLSTPGGFTSYGSKIQVGCLDKNGRFIRGGESDLTERNCLLAVFAALAAQFAARQEENGMAVSDEYFRRPRIESFVTFCERFYQANKTKDYFIEYKNAADYRGDAESMDALFAPRVKKAVLPPAPPVPKAALRGEDAAYTAFQSEDFLPDYRARIPVCPKGAALAAALYPVLRAIGSGRCTAFLQYGRPGSGKTANILTICAMLRLPVVETVYASENTDETLLGKYLPTKNGLVFKETGFTGAVRGGGAVVIEDIHLARPGALSFLHGLLEPDGFVRLDDQTVVRRHKNFRLFATFVPEWPAAGGPGAALLDRFDIVYKAVGPTDEELVRLIKDRVPGAASAEFAVKVYRKLAARFERDAPDTGLSARTLLSWVRLAADIGYPAAAELTLLGAACGDEALEALIRSVVASYSW
ncbi:MAG: AAA family ATPase [Clostridiales bacterium]|jgi:MoxR-like ATPase|nr:AAA family ATPase [Clostridiales bacterium]